MRRRQSGLELFTNFMFNLMFAWPFKFVRWCFRKIRDRRYDIDFSDYSDDEWDENDFDDNETYYQEDEINKPVEKYGALTTLEENVYYFYETQFSKEAKERVSDKWFILHYIVKNKAWRDATIRERFNRDSEIMKNKEKIIELIEDELLNNVENICCDYDGWHNSICELEIYNMRYGVWQKLINMTFKYLYCVKDIFPEFYDIWEMCHCPIDTVIAKQIHSKLSEMNVKQSELILSEKISKSDSIFNWNYISKQDYFKLQEQVAFICEAEDIYPVEFDFLYWKK